MVAEEVAAEVVVVWSRYHVLVAIQLLEQLPKVIGRWHLRVPCDGVFNAFELYSVSVQRLVGFAR